MSLINCLMKRDQRLLKVGGINQLLDSVQSFFNLVGNLCERDIPQGLGKRRKARLSRWNFRIGGFCADKLYRSIRIEIEVDAKLAGDKALHRKLRFQPPADQQLTKRFYFFFSCSSTSFLSSLSVLVEGDPFRLYLYKDWNPQGKIFFCSERS